MSFIIDKQTLDDLGIFGRRQGQSVYGIFNTTHTRGGARILEEMFLNPLDDYAKIERRGAVIDFFRQSGEEFPFQGAWFDAAEYYLSDTDERTRLNAHESNLQKKFQRVLKTDTDFQMMHRGIVALIDIVNALDEFVGRMERDAQIVRLSTELPAIRALLDGAELAPVRAAKGCRKLSLEKAAPFDDLLRYSCRDKVRRLLEYVYLLDVYFSVAKVASARGFARAEVLPATENVLSLHGVFHPLLATPVPNDLTVTAQNNVLFLTGANMAGKSTFMKTFGIAVFLAHVGFPVPAAAMRFSVRSGLYTTINLPDNLNYGYSHFYAEVLRLKKVARSVNLYRNLIVIFDELFRGTNVKDAYDATVSVAEAFAHRKESVFIISTHIIEAGEELRKRCDNIAFVYLPTVLENGRPVYPYTLTEGITADRHGMMIINNEKIIEIIRSRKQ